MAQTWTSSAKDMVGCTLGSSRVWFTLGFGIVNEVYYPRVDTPQMRDLGFIVADGSGFWIEVKRLENYTVRLLAPGTPAVEIVHKHDRFELTRRVTPNPDLDVLAIQLNLTGDPGLRPYVLLAPHLGATGYDMAKSEIGDALCPRCRRRVAAQRTQCRLGQDQSGRAGRDQSIPPHE